MFGRDPAVFIGAADSAHPLTASAYSFVTDDQTFLGDANRPLPHRAFFTAASEYQEGSREYRSLLAGLLVLRLLDKWPKPSNASPEENETRIALFVPVKNAVEAIDDTPVKRVLANLLDAISTFSYGGVDGRLPQLIAYAQFLEYEGRWEPAADVFATAIDLINATGKNADLLLMCYDRSAYCLRETRQYVRAHALLSTGIEIANNQRNQAARQHDEPAIARIDYSLDRMRIAIATLAGEILEEQKEWESAAAIYEGAIDLLKSRPADQAQLPRWFERAAFCYRQLGNLGQAADLLHFGIETAATLGDLRWNLRLRISAAVLERHKGDLPEAEFELDAIIKDAESANETEMVARAMQERGVVAYERNQVVTSAEFHYAAAKQYTDPQMARRALLDAAVALADLGFLAYAQEVCLLVRRAPDDGLESRALAGVNLMRYAALAGDRPAFERLRGELNNEHMSGRLAAHYWLFIGQSLQHFGDANAARLAFEQAVDLAERHHVNKLLIETERILAAGDDRPVIWREDPSPALRALFEDIDAHRGLFAEATST